MIIARLSAALWRWVARRVANHLARTPVIFGDPNKVRIAASARVVNALMNVQSGTIEIGENAFLGHNVLLLTGSHDLTQTGAARRDGIVAFGRDIVIESGAWVNSGAIVIGPCIIGANAVILASSVVTCDVPPNSVMGGVPARMVKFLECQAA